MTFEEWIADETGLPVAEIKFVGAEADPGRRWSEYTEEEFDCKLAYDYAGERRTLWLNATETCRLLNDLFPVPADDRANAKDG